MRKVTRFILWLVGVPSMMLISFLVILWFSLPTLVRWFANHELKNIINAEVSLKKVDLDPLRGYVALHDFHVSQPPGFRQGTLAFVHTLRARLELTSLLHPPLTVNNVYLDGVRFNLAINKDGLLNLTAVPARRSPRPRPSPPPRKKAPSRFAIRGRKVVINNLASSLTVYGLLGGGGGSKSDFLIRIRDFNLRVTEFLWDPRAPVPRPLPGRVRITARIVQQPEDARRGITGRVGPISTRPAAANAVVVLHCLELDPLSIYIPGVTGIALGGDAINLKVTSASAPNMLRARVEAESSGGYTYDVHLSGKLEHPVLALSSLLFQEMLRAGGSLKNAVKNLSTAGGVAGKTAMGTVATVGRGTFKVMSSLGSGIFRTLKGVVTLRPREAVSGLRESTLGTVRSAADLVWDTGSGIVKGVVKSSSASVGSGRGMEWREKSIREWPEAWKKAQQEVEEMGFPEPGDEEDTDPEKPNMKNSDDFIYGDDL
jgi:hypothetical protein